MIQITKKEGKKSPEKETKVSSDINQDEFSQVRDYEDFTGCLHVLIASVLTIQHILGFAAEKS